MFPSITIASPVRLTLVEFQPDVLHQKNYTGYDVVFVCVMTKHWHVTDAYGHIDLTDRHEGRSIYRAGISSRGKD